MAASVAAGAVVAGEESDVKSFNRCWLITAMWKQRSVMGRACSNNRMFALLHVCQQWTRILGGAGSAEVEVVSGVAGEVLAVAASAEVEAGNSDGPLPLSFAAQMPPSASLRLFRNIHSVVKVWQQMQQKFWKASLRSCRDWCETVCI